MISLGSCTMKLNAASLMQPLSLAGFQNMHPFAPADQAEGYLAMIAELEATGMMDAEEMMSNIIAEKVAIVQ